MEPSVDKYSAYKKIIREIDNSLAAIDDDTGLYSTMAPTLEHEDFKKLLGMGTKIIPYLIHKMTHHGSSWTIIMLLHRITGESVIPEEDQGDFLKAIIHWLTWYSNSEIRKGSDIYHGLIK